jgi:hypothetical protein
MAFSTMLGAIFIFGELLKGRTDGVVLGMMFLLGGLIPTWYFCASRVHFHSTFVMNGWFVSRHRCLWSNILPYDEIAKVNITHHTRSTCGLNLASGKTGRCICITTPGLQRMKLILAFLRQRLDKSVFDERALKLLETGELKRFYRP